MVNSKKFNLEPEMTAMSVAEAVEGFFIDKGLISEIIQASEGIIIQSKPQDSWKKYVGMDNSVQVQIYDNKTSIIVNVGSAKWIDKVVIGTGGTILFGPLGAMPAILGAFSNSNLPAETFHYIEMFIATGGKSVAKTIRMSDALKDNEILCPKCNAKNPDTVKFCNSCGEKLTFECEECGADIKPGIKFCSECGEKIKEKPVLTCPDCETVLQENTKFCSECGKEVQ